MYPSAGINAAAVAAAAAARHPVSIHESQSFSLLLPDQRYAVPQTPKSPLSTGSRILKKIFENRRTRKDTADSPRVSRGSKKDQST